MKSITVGTVLAYHTCESFDGIGKNSILINPYDEHWLVQDIRKEGFYMYNLDKGKFEKVVSIGELNYMLHGKKLEITDEIA